MSFHKNRQTRRASRRHPFAATYRPGIESLEDRRLLSAGDLDLTFGKGGLVNTTLGSSSRALAVATYLNAGTANDGKIVPTAAMRATATRRSTASRPSNRGASSST